jgi:hypothetical protein
MSVTLDLDRFSFGFRELPTYHGRYMKIMRFNLVNKEDRTFRVQRWCFRGSVDRWIDLWESRSEGKLADLVKTFCPHIGKDSFFELIAGRTPWPCSEARRQCISSSNATRRNLSQP